MQRPRTACLILLGWLAGLALLAASCVEPVLLPPLVLPQPPGATETPPVVLPQPPGAAETPPDLAPTATLTPQPVDSPSTTPPTSVTLPILMYHHLVVLGPKASRLLRGLTVAPETFEEEMAYLKSHDYHTITFAELVAFFNGTQKLPENPIIITFDDAWADDYTVAYPVLRKYGLGGTFFIPTNTPDRVKSALTWAQIHEMSQGGMEFGSHSVTHPNLTKCRADALTSELLDSKATLEKQTGQAVLVLAYPFGYYNDVVVAAAEKAGYSAAVGIASGLVQSRTRLFTLHRIGIPYGLSTKAFAGLFSVPPRAEPTPAAE